jgi:catechol 2,3-dioxygenase-like lactoylglutathione lyase family enzyme
MKLHAPIPILRVFDYALAIRCYVDWLGFQVDWEHQFDGKGPRYMQVSRDAAVLHLTEHWGDTTPGTRVYIVTDDVVALHKEFHSRPNPNMRPGLCDQPWGAKEMEVIDPFGNRLTFAQRMGQA